MFSEDHLLTYAESAIVTWRASLASSEGVDSPRCKIPQSCHLDLQTAGLQLEFAAKSGTAWSTIVGVGFRVRNGSGMGQKWGLSVRSNLLKPLRPYNDIHI